MKLAYSIQLVAIRQAFRRARERFEQELGALEGSATRMEPQRGLAFAEGVRNPLPEAQLPARDRQAAAAAPGAPGGCEFEHVRHSGRAYTRTATRR